MNKIYCLFAISVICLSCQKRLYNAHPDCGEYFDYVKTHWERKSNGFYLIKGEKADTSRQWILENFGKPPVFQQQWEQHLNKCLYTLSPKEVRSLLGKPTRVSKVFNVIKQQEAITFVYYISDGKCEEIIPKNDFDKCGFIGFTFWDGKQIKGDLPRLNLHE